MTDARMIFSMFLFLGLLTLFAFALTIDTTKLQGLTNTTNPNSSLIISGSGITEVQICQITQDPNLLDILSWGGNCIADLIGFFFGIGGISSTIGWLSIILACIIIAIAYIVVAKIIRGAGG